MAISNKVSYIYIHCVICGKMFPTIPNHTRTRSRAIAFRRKNAVTCCMKHSKLFTRYKQGVDIRLLEVLKCK